MQFIDLSAQQQRIRKKVEDGILRVLNHGKYIMGPEVQLLEEKLCSYVGVKHAVGCASGTDALMLALMAYGVRPGDAVFTTPFTFMATAEAIALLRATPVFVDIDPVTFNIDPAHLEQAIEAVSRSDSSLYPLPGLEPRQRLRPKGVIAVDLFGVPPDYGRINSIAEKWGMFVIEDAAQSFGAERHGKKACSMAHIGCTSFFPAKPLGGYGDGGMCFTDDSVLADTMRSIRIHGQGGDKYENIRIGINGRLDTMQAAVLLAKFEIFPEELELREKVARQYTELLDDDRSRVVCPKIPHGCRSAWAQYSVLAKDSRERASILSHLGGKGIPTAIYYPKPLHLQSAFSYLGYSSGSFPVSEECARKIFSLPMHPYIDEKDQKRIAEAIQHCLQAA